MTIKQALTYHDCDENEEFVFDYLSFKEVADFIRDFLECNEEDYEGEDIEAVAEDMADGKRAIPDWIADEINSYYREQALRWRREPFEPSYEDWPYSR